jgi:hypothetical protein
MSEQPGKPEVDRNSLRKLLALAEMLLGHPPVPGERIVHAQGPKPLGEGWPSALDRLAWFPNWNRNLTLWEFIADD